MLFLATVIQGFLVTSRGLAEESLHNGRDESAQWRKIPVFPQLKAANLYTFTSHNSECVENRQHSPFHPKNHSPQNLF